MNTKVSTSALWTGRAMSGLIVLFMTLDGVMKLVKPTPVVEATTKLGMAENTITPIGLVLLASTALYAFRSTSILGAILLTGFLGGAIATNVHAGVPLFNVLFPAALGLLVWGGLVVRDPRLRALLPLRQGNASEETLSGKTPLQAA